MADPTLYLIRHAQAKWQVERDTNLDSDLTSLGHVQSSALAQRMQSFFPPVTASGAALTLFTSPLRRARATCRYLEAALAVEGLAMPGLVEAPFRVADHLPVALTPFATESSRTGSADYAEFRARAQDTLKSLFAVTGETGLPVVAVGHGGQIKTMLRVATSSDGMCFEILNTGVTILQWREGRWFLTALSCCDHLEHEQRSR